MTIDPDSDDSDVLAGSAKHLARGDRGIYPMRVAVQLTGLTQDTIRAWERRHGAIEPVRTAGNTRKFRPDDIRRLLLLREATEAGHSIGNIAELDNDQLRDLKLLTQPEAPEPEPEPLVPEPSAGAVAGYLELLARFEVVQSAAWLRRLAALHAPRAFVFEVVQPLLAAIRERRADARLGGPQVVVAWQQLTAVLTILLEVSASPSRAPTLVTVGAPRQRHAIHALATTLLARHHGRDAVFLGVAMPDADLLWAVDALGPAVVVVDLANPTSAEVSKSSQETLVRMAKRNQVWVLWPSGAPSEGFEGVTLAGDLATIEALLLESGA